jgi:zinc transport system substrate-binding protein
MKIIPILVVGATLLAAPAAQAASPKHVVAGFYPLAWAAEQIGGKRVSVENLTPTGAEPHDIELAPRQVADLQRADVVLYLSDGFQPAVEQAARGARGARVDVLSGLKLRAGVGDEKGKQDPHIWLDPVLFAKAVKPIGRALGGSTAGLSARLARLDAEYRRGLAQCKRRTFVTSHAAFGYLAARYGLQQLPITGMDPAAEPSPQKLAELVGLVKRKHITTVFFERLVSPKLAETVARETGAKTAVLDPIEGLTPDEAKHGASYVTVMQQNLQALRQALGCR